LAGGTVIAGEVPLDKSRFLISTLQPEIDVAAVPHSSACAAAGFDLGSARQAFQ
jgi:hypothetical protein